MWPPSPHPNARLCKLTVKWLPPFSVALSPPPLWYLSFDLLWQLLGFFLYIWLHGCVERRDDCFITCDLRGIAQCFAHGGHRDFGLWKWPKMRTRPRAPDYKALHWNHQNPTEIRHRRKLWSLNYSLFRIGLNKGTTVAGRAFKIVCRKKGACALGESSFFCSLPWAFLSIAI